MFFQLLAYRQRRSTVVHSDALQPAAPLTSSAHCLKVVQSTLPWWALSEGLFAVITTSCPTDGFAESTVSASGRGEGVGVGVDVGVEVAVPVAVGVAVVAGREVAVGARVGVEVRVAVGVLVAVGVAAAPGTLVVM